jgi:DNA invertase Pin-like site-specific DNA recombinase
MPAAADVPDVYAIYARRSRKKARRQRNDRETVERQIALSRKHAAVQGLAVSDRHEYVDNNRSAWKPDGPRPAWDAMIAAGKRGEFAGVLAYKLDRFSRNVRDAEDLVDLAASRRVVVDGPNSGRIDLSTAHGRRTFREAAVQAAAESDNTSERVRDALAERAGNGLLLGGGRLYGFKVLSTEREEEDDVDARMEPAEVEVIREAARRLLAAEPLAHIAADFNARGLVTVRGGQWNARNLGRMLRAPRYGGHAVLNGKAAGKVAGEPVLDEDTYAEVQDLLTGRRRGRRESGRWPLTGVPRCGNPSCGRAGRGMAGRTSTRLRADGTAPRQYTCPPSNGGCGMAVLAEPVEELVRARVLDDLADADEMAELAERERAVHDARAAAAAEVARLEDKLAELEAKLAAETIREHAYQAAKAVYDRRIADAEAKRDALAVPAPAGKLPATTAAEYDVLNPAERRSLITRLRLEVTVLPLRPGGPRNTFDPERVQIRP